jgi:hypothetical protein
MRGGSAWGRLWFVWVIPALLVIANVVWLAGLRGAVIGQGTWLAQRVAASEEEVQRLEQQQRALAGARSAVEELRSRLDDLRARRLGAMRERLVPFLLDVVERTQRAGLQPERINYTAKADEKSGFVQFTAVYSLTGPYPAIRTCIYLLEESPQLAIIERLALRGDEHLTSVDVGVQLTVSTYFTDMDRALMAEFGVEEVAGGE